MELSIKSECYIVYTEGHLRMIDDHEIISTVILSPPPLPLNHSRRAVVSYEAPEGFLGIQGYWPKLKGIRICL